MKIYFAIFVLSGNGVTARLLPLRNQEWSQAEGAGGFSHLRQWHTLRSLLCFAAGVSAVHVCVTTMIAGEVYNVKSNSQIQFLVNEAFNSVQLSTPDPSTDSEDCLTPSDREFAMIMDRSSPSEVSSSVCLHFVSCCVFTLVFSLGILPSLSM